MLSFSTVRLYAELMSHLGGILSGTLYKEHISLLTILTSGISVKKLLNWPMGTHTGSRERRIEPRTRKGDIEDRYWGLMKISGFRSLAKPRCQPNPTHVILWPFSPSLNTRFLARRSFFSLTLIISVLDQTHRASFSLSYHSFKSRI